MHTQKDHVWDYRSAVRSSARPHSSCSRLTIVITVKLSWAEYPTRLSERSLLSLIGISERRKDAISCLMFSKMLRVWLCEQPDVRLRFGSGSCLSWVNRYHSSRSDDGFLRQEREETRKCKELNISLPHRFWLRPLAIFGSILGTGNLLFAATLFVNPGGTGGCFPTISAAVAAASPNDTVKVAAGTYAEDVVIGKALSLVGASRSTTIIDATGLSDMASTSMASTTKGSVA